MEKTKFKIGDEIYFMKYDEPSKGIIRGFAIIYGEFENSSFHKKGNPKIVYDAGVYVTIDEEKAFATKEELQKSLFAKL